MTKQLVGVMRLEKRSAKRFETSLQVVFVRQGRVIQATAVDISMTGMRLTSEVDLNAGTELNAHFAPQGGHQTYQLEGRVVWSRHSDEIAGLYLSGIAFRTLPPATSEQLASLIRMLGGEHAIDDLPMVDAEEIREAEAETQIEKFSALAEPLPARAKRSASAESPPARARPPPVKKPRFSGEPWQIAEQLKSAVAADYRRRTQNRKRAEQHLQNARQAKNRGDLHTAVPLLREAAELVPDSPEIFEELAATVYLTGNVIESAQLFDRALRMRMERGE